MTAPRPVSASAPAPAPAAIVPPPRRDFCRRLPLALLAAIAVTVIAVVATPRTARGQADPDEPRTFDPNLRLRVVAPPRLLAGERQALRVMLDGVDAATVTLTGWIRRAGAAEWTPLFAMPAAAVAEEGNPVWAVPFDTPALTGAVAIRVQAATGAGVQRVTVDATVVPSAFVTYISTDKPIYQPGQTIRIRVLGLDPLTNTTVPAGEAVTLTVHNSQDVLVWQREIETDAFGLVAAVCPLAREIATGPYSIRAASAALEQELTVIVREYQLPKFVVGIETDQSYFRPDDNVRGRIRVRYTFGEPVAEATVRFSIVAFDSETGDSFGDLGEPVVGTTDAEGVLPFTYRLPARSYLAWFMRADNTALVSCRAVATDAAGIVEVGYAVRTLAVDPIVMTLVPAGRTLVPEENNLLYVRVTYPDGTPVRAHVQLNDGAAAYELETDALGIGELTWRAPAADPRSRLVRRYTSAPWRAAVADSDGNEMQATWSYRAQLDRLARDAGVSTDDGVGRVTTAEVALRPLVARAREGTPIRLAATFGSLARMLAERLGDAHLLSRAADDDADAVTIERAFVDVHKLGHLVESVEVRPADVLSEAVFEVPLRPALFGQIELSLTLVLAAASDGGDGAREGDDADGEGNAGRRVVRELLPAVATTAVFVYQDDELIITVVPDQQQYGPGDRDAVIRFLVTRRSGERGPAVLGVDIVDEAVYALTDEEREQVQLALYLRDRAQGNALATALVDPTLDDDDRERATALLLTLATEPTAAAPSVDSYEYALARTRDVMQRVGGAVHANSAFMRFDGHVVGERAAEDADERLRFQREADPFAWIIEHAADSDGWGWPDFEDAWGNRLRFVYGYNGERVWRLVSAGPDGQLDPLDREGPLDDIVAPFRWSGS